MDDRTNTMLLTNLGKIVSNPYEAVLVASKRARNINTTRLQQMEALTEESESIIDYRKVTTQAIEDLLSSKIPYHFKE